MILGKYWKRSNWQGGFACILSGAIFGCLVLFVPPFKSFINSVFGGPAIPAFLFSCFWEVIISLITPIDYTSEEEAYVHVINERYGKE